MAQFNILQGSERRLLPNSRLAGPVDRSEIASITIRVRSKGNLLELEKLVLSEGAKPLRERKLPTRAKLNEKYGARAEDLTAVEHYAARHNLVVEHRSTAERVVRLRGALGDVLHSFPAFLHLYHHSLGTYRGRSGGIQIPDHLEGIITGIFGLDTRPMRRARPHERVIAAGPGGGNGETATFFAQRYSFPAESKGTALDGSGQTIALIELGGGYDSGDLQVYFNEIGCSVPNVSNVTVGSTNNPGIDSDSDGEVMMDIEIAGTVAPKADIVVYFAPNTGDGFRNAISAAIHDTERKINVISISWGSAEPDHGDQQEIDDYHSLFVEAASQNITICVASGDHGVAVEDQAHWDGKVHVSHPACDPLVIACGGTQIDPASGTDTVWNDETPFAPDQPGGGGWTTGGGFSQLFGVPDYQQGTNLGAPLPGQNPGRGLPDLAMSAVDYFVRVDSAEGSGGGTSAVAPLMAALIARLNQAKGVNSGFINPLLYQHPEVFHDVTGGSNAIMNTTAGYDAGFGWDACTGLGTPDGTAILGIL